MLIFYLRRKKFSISFILLSLNYGALSTCGWIQKIIHNYFIILFEVACCKWVRKISETFVFEDKINKPNAKASIHYWIKPVLWKRLFWYFCYFYFSWNVFNTKAIKVPYVITIYMQGYPVSSYWFQLIKTYYICSIFNSVSFCE